MADDRILQDSVAEGNITRRFFGDKSVVVDKPVLRGSGPSPEFKLRIHHWPQLSRNPKLGDAKPGLSWLQVVEQ